MLIENIASTNYFAHSILVKQKENKNFSDNTPHTSKRSDLSKKDSYVSSSNKVEPTENVKAKNLSEVKSRIVAGFYNSPEVNDDLTDVFSEIFKKTFS